MIKAGKILLILFILLLVIVGAFLFFRYKVYYSRGENKNSQIFTIDSGEGNLTVAARLESAGIISGKWYFYYYLRTHGLINKIMPGDYNLSGVMSIPEVADAISNLEKSYTKVTFPEGFTPEQMADLLGQNGFDKDGFLSIEKNPDQMRPKFDFLADKNITNLDGYLFPDTYFFTKDATADDVVFKMLDDFSKKMTPDLREAIQNQNETINDEIKMASVIQGEVKTADDMKMVSGIFWKRLSIDMPLQSDAAPETYKIKGLPESAVNNPGMEAITAAIYPQASDYLYFVSDKQTGQTLFAKTMEEHNKNIAAAGL